MEKHFTIPAFNISNFMVEAAAVEGSIASQIYAAKYDETPNRLTVYVRSELTDDEEAALADLVAAHNPNLIPPPVIMSFLPPGTDDSPESVMKVDYSILGLKNTEPLRDRGRKVSTSYLRSSDDKLVVKKTFSDVIEDGNLVGIFIRHEWYNEDGSVAFFKESVAKKFDAFRGATVRRQRRQEQIDFLVSAAQSSPEPLASAVGAIFDEMKSAIDHYVGTGDNSQMAAVLDGMADPAHPLKVVAYDTQIPRTDLPIEEFPAKYILVHQSIRYQIGDMSMEQIESDNGYGA